MARKSEELSNYQRYLANVKHRGYANLPIPDHEESIDELIAEGERLLEKEAQMKSSPRAEVTSKPSPSNPYLLARKKLLEEMDSEKQKLIERLEREGKTDSYQYQDFVKQIMTLGDKLSQ